MDLKSLKALAEKFRSVAGDKKAIAKLATDHCSAHPPDADCKALCDRFKAAADQAAVLVIADEIKARTS